MIAVADFNSDGRLDLALALVHLPAQRADVRAGAEGALDQVPRHRRRARRTILVACAIAAGRLAHVLDQQQPRSVQEPHAAIVPLHGQALADAPGGHRVVRAVDLDVAVQMHRALAVLVVAEGLDGQRPQMRQLLGKHRRDLALGRAVDARVGPARLPAIQVRLRLVDGLEAQAAQRRLGAARRRTRGGCRCRG
jgi:hypothetical protein